MPREELKSRIKYVAKGKQYDLIMDKLVAEGTVKVFGSMAKAPNFSVIYTKEQQKLRDLIEKDLLEGGWSPKPVRSCARTRNVWPFWIPWMTA